MTDARSPWDRNRNAPTGNAPTVPPAGQRPDPDQTEVVWAPQPIGPRTGVEGGGQPAPGTAAWERPGGLAPEPPPWSPAAKARKRKLPGVVIAAIAAGLAVVAAVAAYLVVAAGSTHTATTPAAIQRPATPTTVAPKTTAPAAAPASAGSSASSSVKAPSPAVGSSSGSSSSGSASSGSSVPASSSSSSGPASGRAPSGSSSASTPTTADQGGCGCADIDPPAADNLAATPDLKQELAQALAAHLGIPASAVDGTYPGTVYYGLDTSTGVNYAVAAIAPSASTLAMDAPTVSPYGFYEENPWAFEQQPNGSWEVDPNGGISPMSTSCPSDFPAAVLQVWGQTPGACHFPTGS